MADDKNDTREILHAEHDGMGSFYLNPLPGHTYQLNWTDESGITGATPIAVTKNEGAQLTVTKTTDKARFQVERTATVPENLKKMMMVIHMNQVGLYQVAINTTDKTKVNSEIPIKDLPTGLLQFTLFTSDWIPVAERVIFINNHSHEFDVKMRVPVVNTDKRGKNVLEVIVPDTLLTNMSLAITDADVTLPDQRTIFSDILLSSDIRGKVYNPGYYFSGSSDSVAAHLDLVMLTNGWRRFNWDKVRNHIAPKIMHPAETGYMKLTGQVSGLKKNRPETELNLVIVDKDSSRQFISVPLEKNGSFEHPLVLFDTATVFYSFNTNKTLAEKAKLKIATGMLQLSPTTMASISDPALLSNQLAKQKLDMLLAEQERLANAAAENILEAVIVTGKAKTKLEQLNERYATGFFRGNSARRSYAFDLTDPDKPIVMQGALQFLQNKIPGLEVTCPSMLNCSVFWRRSDGSPDFYIDEMPATLDMIVSIPITNISLIKAFPPPFFYSNSGMLGGAIAVYTKKMEDYKQADVRGLPNLVLAGYSKFKEFYSPSYDDSSDQVINTDNRNHAVLES
ncbi:MAG: hypothetical protein EOO04_24640 [Chitinophagaceae bacterium]|nr:MAG: hypothetical protein EOO04_24640 [Chitinophagaceae bacterium]